ncbi:hypothetical protein MNBD_GAMMA12-237 [hydrothermal vent metagenome]|uniref:Uncharacterized protein n=1 Tax=hydrothermal vent metagenome TaxID=652676 RepID=A0A3B0YK00_9ZZZZ
MDNLSYKFVTDTSTLCVFDLSCLKHRLEDDVDWWSIPSEELAEVNLGNVAFLGLGSDGEFVIEIMESISQPIVKTNIKVPSGKIFIGAGEEVTADELEPDCVRGRGFLSLEAGNYILSARVEGSIIQVSFELGKDDGNHFKDLLRLVD